MDDYNSDEDDTIVVQDRRVEAAKWARSGQASLDELLADAVAVRRTSKEDYKARKDFSTNAGTVASHYLWENRFAGFRADILKVANPKSPVTGQHIERCLTSFARSISDRLKRPLTVHWATAAIKLMILYGRREADGETKLSSKEVESLKSSIVYLQQQNVLTKEYLRERHTVTLSIAMMIAQRFLAATIFNEERHGLPYSRLVLAWALVIVLMGTGARPGDLTLTAKIERDGKTWQFLRYADISIIVSTDGDTGDRWKLAAKIILRAAKGKKGAKTKDNHVVYFDSDLAEAKTDPIVAIIVMAMRTGQLPRVPFDDFLRTSTRIRGPISWAHPDRPVFHSFSKLMEPEPERVMSALGTNRVVQQVVKAAGLEGHRITPYSFRRGQAQDVMNLTNLPRHTLAHVADALNHSHRATTKGLTKNYAGTRRIDYLSHRRAEVKDLEGLDQFNPLTFGKRKTSDGDEVDINKPTSQAQAPAAKRGRGVALQAVSVNRSRTSDTPYSVYGDVPDPYGIGVSRENAPRTPFVDPQPAPAQRRAKRARIVDDTTDEQAEDSFAKRLAPHKGNDAESEIEDPNYTENDADSVDYDSESGKDVQDEAMSWLTTGGNAVNIAEELPNVSLPSLSTCQFVDHLVSLSHTFDYSTVNDGTLYRPDAPDGFAKNDDGTFRCNTCLQDVKAVTKHVAACQVDFTPSFWGDATTKDGKPAFPCIDCGKIFSWTANLRTGIRGHNRTCKSRSREAPTDANVLKCPHCNVTFSILQPKRLTTHIEIYHKSTS